MLSLDTVKSTDMERFGSKRNKFVIVVAFHGFSHGTAAFHPSGKVKQWYGIPYHSGSAHRDTDVRILHLSNTAI